MADFTRGQDRMGTNIASAIAAMLKSMPPPQPKPQVVAAPKDPFAEPKEEKKADPMWETLILRGKSQEKRSFPLAEAELEDAKATAAGQATADRAEAAGHLVKVPQAR